MFIFSCDLKVEIRIGSVYNGCLSSFGCMQEFGENERRVRVTQGIAENTFSFLRPPLYM